MEITLEKIELVKDRTGVSYREAKDALEACDGSVVDAIIAIEESIGNGKAGKTGEYVKTTMAKVKELVNKGNVTKVSVKKGDDVIVNIPVNVGIVGAVLAPWGLLAAAIAAFGLKCRVELTTTDGKVINVSEKAENAVNIVKEKSSVVMDEIKEKAPDYVEKAKEAGTEAFNNLKEKAPEYVDKAKEAGTEAFNTIREKAPQYVDKAKEAGTEAFNSLREKVAGEDDFEIEIKLADEDVNEELNK